MPGAGTNLHDVILAWTGESPDLTCSCKAYIAKMDRNLGWAKAHVDVITEKLLREAKKRAVQWKAVPMNAQGTLLNAAWNKAWKGVFIIPGSGVLLGPFVKQMVLKAISMAESDLTQDGVWA
jgi:hypothetical protein